jgi:hypothetical protein
MIHRPFTLFLKNHFKGKKISGIEVGVLDGYNARSMLKILNIEKLYLVDLYGKIEYEEGNTAGETIDYSEHYKIAKNNLKEYEFCTNFIRKKSTDAIHDISEKVDFVYIDACHDYKSVLEDIKTYYPILKSGGIIGGHDFCPRYPGVARAVNEFFVNPKIICDNMGNEWWKIKE